jgi:hypothetical protein
MSVAVAELKHLHRVEADVFRGERAGEVPPHIQDPMLRAEFGSLHSDPSQVPPGKILPSTMNGVPRFDQAPGDAGPNRLTE